MSTTKRILGDYNIRTVDSSGNVAGNVVFTTNTLSLTGDLFITGNMTTVNSSNLTISDNFITLNYGEAGAGVTLGNSGIEIDRGSLANVGLRWNETGLTWEFSDQNGDFGPLVVGLINETDPTLGGNLTVNGYEIQSANTDPITLRALGNGNIQFITDGTGDIVFHDFIRLVKLGSSPTPLTDNNYVYHRTVGSGGSGLFINNTESNPNEDELISKQRAIVYSLIL